MIVNSFLSGFTSESRKSSGRLSQTGIDLELVNPGNHNGTIELEEERQSRSRAQYPASQSEQLVFDEQWDFREHLDDDELGVGNVFCQCNTHPEITFCPLCDHPDVRKDEICICNMPLSDFARVQLKTKRKAIAYNDDGKPLSDEYCAVIIKLDEARDICIRVGLSQFLFER